MWRMKGLNPPHTDDYFEIAGQWSTQGMAEAIASEEVQRIRRDQLKYWLFIVAPDGSQYRYF